MSRRSSINPKRTKEMKTKFISMTHNRAAGIAAAALAGVLTFSVTLNASEDRDGAFKPTSAAHAAHADHQNGAVSTNLIDIVRAQTRGFVNVNNATAAGYQPLFGSKWARWACITST
jgi:hypothetical protein